MESDLSGLGTTEPQFARQAEFDTGGCRDQETGPGRVCEAIGAGEPYRCTGCTGGYGIG